MPSENASSNSLVCSQALPRGEQITYHTAYRAFTHGITQIDRLHQETHPHSRLLVPKIEGFARYRLYVIQNDVES